MIFSNDWRRFLHPNREGWIRVTPEDADDIWALYNIISPGDEIESMTMRRVLQENASGTVVDSQKVKVLLAVVAEKIDVDIKGASLRVNGKNVRENKHVKVILRVMTHILICSLGATTHWTWSPAGMSK